MNVADKEIEFPYTAINQDGKTASGYVTARSRGQAIMYVKKYGYKRVRINEKDSLFYRIWNFFPGWKKKLALAYILLFASAFITAAISVAGVAPFIIISVFTVGCILLGMSIVTLFDL